MTQTANRKLGLNTIFSPHSADCFLIEYFGVTYLHVTGTAGRFADLLPSAPAAAFANQLEFENRLEYEIEAPVSIRVESGRDALAVSRAERDEIILQLAGCNGWRIYDSAVEQPGELRWESALQDGDAIYIPRGLWREAGGGDDSAVRLIATIDNPTGADLLAWVTEMVKDQEFYRAPVPRFAAPGARAEYAASLTQTLERVLTAPDLLERYTRYLNNHALPREAGGLPWNSSLSGKHIIALATPRRLRVRRDGEETIRCWAGGRRFTFPLEAAQFFHFLADRAPVSIADFYLAFEKEFDREDLSNFLAALSGSGMISLHEPGHEETT